jgi:hypothetical protein
MERIATEPEVTVRRLMMELAERGVAVSYGTVWNFIHTGAAFEWVDHIKHAEAPGVPSSVIARSKKTDS